MPISTRTYDAYGGRHMDAMRSHTAFAGLPADADARLYLLGARPYSPDLRRFLAADRTSPFEAGGANRYAYCGGDPVGRVDPAGQSWSTWFASTLERMQFTVSTIRQASGGEASFATPTLAAGGTVSVEGATIRHALLNGSQRERIVALKAYGNASAHVAGPGAVSTQLVELSDHPMTIVWPHKGRTASATVFSREQRTIQVVQGPHAFSNDPLRAPTAGTGRVSPEWIEHTNRKGGVHFASTTSVWPDDLGSLKAQIDARYPGRPVTILAGVHGVMHGNTWNTAGQRMYNEPRFFHRSGMKKHELGWRARMLNYAQIDLRRFRSLLQEGEDIFVHFTCFGLADRAFMKAFDIRDVTLRSLDPVPDFSGNV